MKMDIINKSWYGYNNKKNDNIEEKMHKLNTKEELS